jgi:cytochrome c peroxidase
VHKIHERFSERTRRRVDDKDALDVLRLLRAVPTTRLAATFATLLETEPAAAVTGEAVSGISELFSDPRAAGSQMAARAAGPLADPDEIAASSSALARDLVEAIAVVLQRK